MQQGNPHATFVLQAPLEIRRLPQLAEPAHLVNLAISLAPPIAAPVQPAPLPIRRVFPHAQRVLQVSISQELAFPCALRAQQDILAIRRVSPFALHATLELMLAASSRPAVLHVAAVPVANTF